MRNRLGLGINMADLDNPAFRKEIASHTGMYLVLISRIWRNPQNPIGRSAPPLGDLYQAGFLATSITDEYLADAFQTTTKTITRWRKQLEEAGLIIPIHKNSYTMIYILGVYQQENIHDHWESTWVWEEIPYWTNMSSTYWTKLSSTLNLILNIESLEVKEDPPESVSKVNVAATRQSNPIGIQDWESLLGIVVDYDEPEKVRLVDDPFDDPQSDPYKSSSHFQACMLKVMNRTKFKKGEKSKFNKIEAEVKQDPLLQNWIVFNIQYFQRNGYPWKNLAAALTNQRKMQDWYEEEYGHPEPTFEATIEKYVPKF
jgi:hypothetical protein